MSPLLIVHIGAGSLGMISGVAALSVRKGERLHRASGTVFLVCMLILSAMAVELAVLPKGAAMEAPPRASVAVSILTFYLVATGWMTVRRKPGSIGRFEHAAPFVASGTALALLVFGLQAADSPSGRPGGYGPYLAFAAFAAFASVLDLRVVLHGGISGVPRLARHLWRMGFALFFASAFFFLGQQKVMPAFMQGSPVLLLPAIAPLVVMIFWLFRIRATPAQPGSHPSGMKAPPERW